MFEQNVSFQIGDPVIHWAYGLGEIIQLDEKKLFGQTSEYYVVQIRDITLWVPINGNGESSLRALTPAKDFKKLFGILAGPGKPLSDDRMERKSQLAERLKDGRLESICRVVRDLSFQGRSKKLNENDQSILARAQGFLLDEWSTVLSIPIQEAEKELKELLGGNKTPVK